MASTPAVGPSPTMRTNNSAQTSSGTERSSTSNQRTPCRTRLPARRIRPDSSREIDSDSVASSVSGIAPNNASVKPAVAMATVCQVAAKSRARNSPECAGGTKLARNCQLAARLCASNKLHGLNSLYTSIGHSTTRKTAAAVTRPRQAGSA